MIRPVRHTLPDRGLTLTELLITIAVTGIVITVLAGATTTFLRNQHSASDRVDQTRGLQQLVNFFPRDVSSAQIISVTSGESCGTGGSPILSLAWSEQFGDDQVAVQVTYRESTEAENTLTRFSCHSGGPASPVVLARGFDWLEVNSATFSDGRVLITLQFPDARRTLVAQSRNVRGVSP